MNETLVERYTTACLDGIFLRGDANSDGRLDISDAIFVLDFLFQGGSEIPPPYPARGPDPTPDDAYDCRHSV